MEVKSYSSKVGVVKALLRQGLNLMKYEVVVYDAPKSKGYTASITVDNADDAQEVRNRGFIPKIVREE